MNLSYRNGISLILFSFCLIVASLIFWFAKEVFLLAFASILLSLLLQGIGELVRRVTHLPYQLSFLLGLILFIGILTAIFWIYSPIISTQFATLVQELPAALDQLQGIIARFFDVKKITGDDLSKFFTDKEFLTQVTKVFAVTLQSIIWFFIFLLLGLYISYSPERYLRGFLPLFPTSKRGGIHTLLQRIGNTLRIWLVGKILSMMVIGLLTYLGLLFLKIPLAFILGLIAGLFAFIPYIGAILASIPALLIALAHSPLMALYVLILFLLIHFLEGYFITPYIELKTVYLPPAFTIFMQILFTLLFGFMGLALASPLTVLLIILLQNLYIEEAKE